MWFLRFIKYSVDIIQAIDRRARGHNAEVSSTLIIHINSKFIVYYAFVHEVLIRLDETKFENDQKMVNCCKDCIQNQLSAGQFALEKIIVKKKALKPFSS